MVGTSSGVSGSPRLRGSSRRFRRPWRLVRLLSGHKVLWSDEGSGTGRTNQRQHSADDEQDVECAGKT